jgi:membrane protein YqaA with SNARE-associated domain
MALTSRLNLSALLWGLAEATLFFIVPDVLLTVIALRRLRAALVGCAWATAGALAGGLLMYGWGTAAPAYAWQILDYVPGIGVALQTSVRDAMARNGLAALFLGPLTGTPYKLYAVAAGQQGQSLAAFLLVSVPARAIRFALVSLLAHTISRHVAEPLQLRVLMLCWLIFYVGYFTHMGW